MLIIGAGGHAKEVFDVLYNNGEKNLFFYDDISANSPVDIFNQFPVITTIEEAMDYFKKTDNRFVLGVGGTEIRKQLSDKIISLGGQLTSVISMRAYVSAYDVSLGSGVNIMHNVTIQPSVKIGEGTLINANVIIHHDTDIGKFCEIGPASVITGNCTIGDFSFIGAGAILKPGVKLGCNVVVGAGAVVINDIPDNTTVTGIPAKPVKE